ncbi:galactose-3-O-sulfotransferase 4-like [Mytilus californianus]|uniref:galactose-3-O-sulfotransferase 4-like n=1 Tax=Mytilus californianus TaxID=6549 RepID=UPI0022471C4E|nr:galactose-3-O-sulfotransferase 4-like [Mytilus californianus]
MESFNVQNRVISSFDREHITKLSSSKLEKDTYLRYLAYNKYNTLSLEKIVATIQINRKEVNACTQPQQKVVFLKVHKAGSTTVQNIFLRYGDTNGLNIALPKTYDMECFNYLGFESILNKSRIMTLPRNETMHIFCNHAIYNKEVYTEFMGLDTLYIGILRDPVTQWTSATFFYGFIEYLRDLLGEHLEDRQLLSAFLEYPNIFHNCPHTHNSMFEDLGLSLKDSNNQSAAEKYLRLLDNDIAFVMFMEHFDESLILLKRLLCWDIKDIMYVPLNINSEKRKRKIHLTDKDQHNLFKYNYADFRLYVHFKEKFYNRIKQSGNNFFSEVKKFKNARKSVTEYCKICLSANFSSCTELTILPSEWSEQFTITGKDCRFMMSQEESLLLELMNKAKQRYGINHQKN